MTFHEDGFLQPAAEVREAFDEEAAVKEWEALVRHGKSVVIAKGQLLLRALRQWPKDMSTGAYGTYHPEFVRFITRLAIGRSQVANYMRYAQDPEYFARYQNASAKSESRIRSKTGIRVSLAEEMLALLDSDGPDATRAALEELIRNEKVS